jgi:hypothetical protein
MFGERDHIHTMMYQLAWASGQGGVPPELALDHPFGGLTATAVKLHEGVSVDDLRQWVGRLRPELELGFTPIPLPPDAPVKQTPVEGHVLNLSFTTDSPTTWWDEQHAAAEQLEREGIGRMLWTAPFIPTIPGTDTYTDALW